MSRLYDNVLARGRAADMGDGHFCMEPPVECLEDATVIWAENAAAYFYENADNKWDLAKDFPTLAPPFKNFFVEYNAPRDRGGSGALGPGGPRTVTLGGWEVPLWDEGLRENGSLSGSAPENSRGFGSRWGFLFSSVDLRNELDEPAGPELTVMDETSPDAARKLLREGSDADDYRWIVDAVMFLDAPGQRPVGPVFWWRMFLAPDGSVARLPPEFSREKGHRKFVTADGVAPFAETGDPSSGDSPAILATYAAATAGFGGHLGSPQFTASVSGMILPALFAVSLMNCKNVALDPQDPPEKVSRKHERRHGKPLSRYHLLDIEPMKRVLKDEGDAGTEGLARALHITRGHMKTFSEDAPLFGKHAGTYWWPQHIKGSPERGKIEKDYNVLAPGEPGSSPAAGTTPEALEEQTASDEKSENPGPREPKESRTALFRRLAGLGPSRKDRRGKRGG